MSNTISQNMTFIQYSTPHDDIVDRIRCPDKLYSGIKCMPMHILLFQQVNHVSLSGLSAKCVTCEHTTIIYLTILVQNIYIFTNKCKYKVLLIGENNVL